MCRVTVTRPGFYAGESDNLITVFVSDELADWIVSDREPTIRELLAQAECLWIDGGAGRSAFSWVQLAPALSDRVLALRNAQMALTATLLTTRLEEQTLVTAIPA